MKIFKVLSFSIALLLLSLVSNFQPVSAEDINKDVDYAERTLEDLSEEELAEYYRGKAAHEKVLKEMDMQIKEGDPTERGTMGNAGDVFISMKGKSSTDLTWTGGHAALVVDPYTTIEAFGLRDVKTDGVRYWTNNFRDRFPDAVRYSVKGATSTIKQNAVKYAQAQLYDPYNYNFFSKWKENEFYCSQIVWRAYYEQGIDLDDGGTAVWPVDLVQGGNLY